MDDASERARLVLHSTTVRAKVGAQRAVAWLAALSAWQRRVLALTTAAACLLVGFHTVVLPSAEDTELFGGRWPTHLPAVGIATSPGRSKLLLATVRNLHARVDHLILCNAAPTVPEPGCALEELAALVDAGDVPVGKLTVVTPTHAPGPFYGTSECWNTLADKAFGELRAPWLLVLNDDIGFEPGVLRLSARAAWRGHAQHSIMLANSGLPGLGHAFSAFVLTAAGFGALGRFDENYFPAYYEDCDYMRRVQLLGMPWKHLRQLKMLHPIQFHVPTPELGDVFHACMARRADEVEAGEVLVAAQRAALQRYHYGDWDTWPHSDRAYYRNKWGTSLLWKETCLAGDKATPYGDVRRPLSFWAWNQTMRDAIMAATGLPPSAWKRPQEQEEGDGAR